MQFILYHWKLFLLAQLSVGVKLSILCMALNVLITSTENLPFKFLD